jgi:hypothetical protein
LNVSKRCRRFTILDAMIMLAAASLGVAIGRGQWSHLAHLRPRNWDSPTSWAYGQYEIIMGFLWAVVPLLAAWTIALLAIRLRHPRRRLRRAIREPGTAATVVSSFSLAVSLATYTLSVLNFRKPMSWSIDGAIEHLFMLHNRHGCYVLGAWAVLVFCGRWKPERCWLDHLGRMLGASWIGFSAAWGFADMSIHLFRPMP